MEWILGSMRQRLQEGQDEAGKDDIAHREDHHRCGCEIDQQQACLAAGMFLLLKEVHCAGAQDSSKGGGRE